MTTAQPGSTQRQTPFPDNRDRATIRRMIAAHQGFSEIAAKLKVRSWTQIRDEAALMGLLAKSIDGGWTLPHKDTAVGLAKAPPKERACMTCGKKFISDGAHHRLCRYCRTRQHSPFEI